MPPRRHVPDRRETEIVHSAAEHDRIAGGTPLFPGRRRPISCSKSRNRAAWRAIPNPSLRAVVPAPLRAGGRSKRRVAMNIEKYTARARGFIQRAQQIALGRGHQQFTPVHLLKVLMDDDQGLGSGLIDRSGGDSKAVRAGVEASLKKIPVVSGADSQIYLSREMARVFDTAERAAQKAGASFVTVERLLLALVSDKDTDAGKVLSSAG